MGTGLVAGLWGMGCVLWAGLRDMWIGLFWLYFLDFVFNNGLGLGEI